MIKFSKKLGQNFLVNPKINQEIARATEVTEGDIILEVGAGTGLLTEKLAKTGAKIITVEKDRNLIPALKKKFENQKNVTIIEGDILKSNPQNYKLRTMNYKLVGNIPYYLTSHLIKMILEDWPRPKVILFVIQKEVARRITAKPPEMSLLALSVQFYADAKILKYISKENFRPVPKVDSALIKIVPKERPSLTSEETKKIFKLAHAGFGSKRKQIINSLSSGLNLPRGVLGNKLREASIDSKRRPESLTLDEWTKLSQILSSQL